MQLKQSAFRRFGAGLRSVSVFAQQPTFRTGTRTVALYATVTDSQKRLVPDLDAGRLSAVRQREAADD